MNVNDSVQEVATRLPNGRFPSGVSGNPGGRVVCKYHLKLRNLAAKDIDKLYNKCWEIIESPEARDTAKVTLILALLERAAGRVVTKVDINTDNSDTAPGTLSADELLRRIDYYEELMKKPKKESVLMLIENEGKGEME